MAGLLSIIVICGTIVAVVNIRAKARVAVARARPANISLVQRTREPDPGHLTADAGTGEVLEDPEYDPQMGVNESGRWADAAEVAA